MKKPSDKIDTDYLEDVLDVNNFSKVVENTCAAIKLIAPKAEGIAFRGASGSLISMAICAKTKKKPMLIRKEKNCHSLKKFEGYHCDSFVIVDDCVNSGATVRSILAAISETYCESIQTTIKRCKAILCYTYTYKGQRKCNGDAMNGNHETLGTCEKEDKVYYYGVRGAVDSLGIKNIKKTLAKKKKS